MRQNISRKHSLILLALNRGQSGAERFLLSALGLLGVTSSLRLPGAVVSDGRPLILLMFHHLRATNALKVLLIQVGAIARFDIEFSYLFG